VAGEVVVEERGDEQDGRVENHPRQDQGPATASARFEVDQVRLLPGNRGQSELGSSGRIRTYDPPVNSRMLYR